MTEVCPPGVRNRLLARLPDDECKTLMGEMEAIDMPLRFVLVAEDHPIEYVYFLNSGIASIVVNSANGKSVEAGLIGRDGVTPPMLVDSSYMGSYMGPLEIFMQVPGTGLRIARAALLDYISTKDVLADLMRRYAQVLMLQISFTALSNAAHTLDQRLARWLLMCHDRIEADEIPITHEFLSTMLAVRRPSVTDALHSLEGHRLIRSERGRVEIRDRAGLESFASDSYGRPESEYRRLIGDL